MKIDFVFACIACAVSIYGVYTSLNSKSIQQATQIETQKLELKHLKECLHDHSKRLDNHDAQNRTLVAMAEQLKNLTEDVKDLKELMKERKEL